MCECLMVGQKSFRPQSGASLGVCSCCGETRDVINLPVGREKVAYCVRCLNPGAAPPEHGRNRAGASVRGIQRGVRFVRDEHFPQSLRHALSVDTAFPLTNEYPSAQRQKKLDTLKNRNGDR